jgi:hypothetical protein
LSSDNINFFIFNFVVELKILLFFQVIESSSEGSDEDTGKIDGGTINPIGLFTGICEEC